jgi:hypothetical protein
MLAFSRSQSASRRIKSPDHDSPKSFRGPTGNVVFAVKALPPLDTLSQRRRHAPAFGKFAPPKSW